MIEPLAPPVYSVPARPRTQTRVPLEPEAIILDPYSVYQQGGSDLLLEELSALSAAHLRQIIRAHALAEESVALDRMDREELMTLIAQGVRAASHSSTRH